MKAEVTFIRVRFNDGMPSYIAFLRAINLGRTRKFPKADIVAAVESTGATGVETYINSGNVRLNTRMRSRARVEASLEQAFALDRGFEVPTIAFTPAELVEIAEVADDLRAEHGPEAHYITLYKESPAAEAAREVERLGIDKEVVRVRGRAAHVLLMKNYHEARVLGGREFKALGQGTARNVTVIRELASRWG